MFKYRAASFFFVVILIYNMPVYGVSYYYNRNLNVLHLNNYGDFSFSLNYSNLNSDLTAGFAFSKSFAAFMQYSSLPSKSDGIVGNENETLQSIKSQKAFSFGLGYFLNDSLSYAVRTGAFLEYTFGSVQGNALTLHRNLKKGEMLVRFNTLSLSSNILLDANPVNRYLKFGYSARLNSIFMQFARSQPADYFTKDSLSLGVSKVYFTLEHGLIIRLLGKRFNLHTQFGLSHRIYPLKSLSPINKLSKFFVLGVTFIPNLFHAKRHDGRGSRSSPVKEVSDRTFRKI